ncbi:glycosyltransferase [Longimicrobium terrae]|uniref:Glycosyltransferase involved in cell wall biosynthesis n=1 Tax=Longimicrobium terrae TaxID=1639882 RepID=A0A841H4T6_9BACT|nr:glycosyltransferase involved in cell wall biosynthesis [Longimicrobium terrae]MBB6072906.1 glycosyltransferase involved in cell wall biosynthesis [Longimicrobium terrae]NNC31519.1 glycosyltransferase family 4 protein [Longimicrobium terrae]
MLRVLHIIYDDPANPWVAGGGAVRVLELYRHLADRVDVTVATGNYPGARDETIGGVRYVRLGAPGPYAYSRLTYARAANALLRSAAYDAAVFDFSTYTPVFVPTDRPAGITVHHVSGPTARARWGPVLAPAIGRLERMMIRRAARLSATSLATRDLLRALAPGVPIDMVYAGVPDELFTLPRAPEEYLLYFGRLDVFQKGLDTLLEAVALLARERPGLELRIAGRGKDAERVAAMSRALGIDGNIRMLGAVSEQERQALFAGAAVQLMPSRFEGFGMVAAEAMAAGVPLVAAAAGSLPEVVDAPRGGLTVPAGDAAALAEATARLLDDRAERARLSRSARVSAERFRWAAVAADHLAFLHRIAEGRTAPPSPSARP